MEARDVLKRPVITEKSSEAMAEDKYTDVDTRANKTQVKIAVEEIFDVKVANVNIINYKPKKNVWAVTKAIQTKEESNCYFKRRFN